MNPSTLLQLVDASFIAVHHKGTSLHSVPAWDVLLEPHLDEGSIGTFLLDIDVVPTVSQMQLPHMLSYATPLSLCEIEQGNNASRKEVLKRPSRSMACPPQTSLRSVSAISGQHDPNSPSGITF